MPAFGHNVNIPHRSAYNVKKIILVYFFLGALPALAGNPTLNRKPNNSGSTETTYQVAKIDAVHSASASILYQDQERLIEGPDTFCSPGEAASGSTLLALAMFNKDNKKITVFVTIQKKENARADEKCIKDVTLVQN